MVHLPTDRKSAHKMFLQLNKGWLLLNFGWWSTPTIKGDDSVDWDGISMSSTTHSMVYWTTQ